MWKHREACKNLPNTETRASTKLAIIQRSREEIHLNKPILCAMAILEASKRLMFGFHYGFMMRKFNLGSMSCASPIQTPCCTLQNTIRVKVFFIDNLATLWILSCMTPATIFDTTSITPTIERTLLANLMMNARVSKSESLLA